MRVLLRDPGVRAVLRDSRRARKAFVPASTTYILCFCLSFAWPDRSEAFDGFDLTVGSGRTGLIGLNG
jgi:hypothetical protein